MNILEALDDQQLFGATFTDPVTWQAWHAFLAALYGLPLDGEALALYRQCTKRQAPPTAPARESWMVVGRRGGKSRMGALVAVFTACFRDYREVLAPGERGTLRIVAADRRQARSVMGYVNGLLAGCPMLGQLVAHRTAEAVELTNRVTIEIHTASWRSLRGYTVVGAVLDEVAFWRADDSANPDREILAALRPAMATVPGALLLAISSPYARRGVLWDAYRRHFGHDGDVLIWQAPTRTMNPRIPAAEIDRAYADDEAAASAEYGAEFRRDLEAFVAREALEACVVPGRYELPPDPRTAHVAFADPSGGSADSFSLAVAHGEDRDGQRIALLDAIREVRPPFSPEAVVAEYADLLKRYDVHVVQGDKYAWAWPVEGFAKHGITYEPSAAPKSDLYRDLLPLLNSGRVELLDVPRLHAQLLGLERRTSRGGRDSIDHGPGGHDDVVNAAAGALVAAAEARIEAEIWAANLADEPYRPVMTANNLRWPLL